MSQSPHTQCDQATAGDEQRDSRVHPQLAVQSPETGQRFAQAAQRILESSFAAALRQSALMGFASR
jgi:hypothetical protein